MGDPIRGNEGGEPAPAGPRAALFVALFVAYYAVYYVFFSLRLAEYFRDLLAHFAFFRRLFE